MGDLIKAIIILLALFIGADLYYGGRTIAAFGGIAASGPGQSATATSDRSGTRIVTGTSQTSSARAPRDDNQAPSGRTMHYRVKKSGKFYCPHQKRDIYRNITVQMVR